MKSRTFDRRQDSASDRKDRSSRHTSEIGAAGDAGFTGLADEELEFFDTVGIDPDNAADALGFAGVRVRH
jgi:hypothetical protein